jgi:hypothetical protein
MSWNEYRLSQKNISLLWILRPFQGLYFIYFFVSSSQRHWYPTSLLSQLSLNKRKRTVTFLTGQVISFTQRRHCYAYLTEKVEQKGFGWRWRGDKVQSLLKNNCNVSAMPRMSEWLFVPLGYRVMNVLVIKDTHYTFLGAEGRGQQSNGMKIQRSLKVGPMSAKSRQRV